MTNGGGVTEAEKAEQLSEWLNIHVHPDQVTTLSVHQGPHAARQSFSGMQRALPCVSKAMLTPAQ